MSKIKILPLRDSDLTGIGKAILLKEGMKPDAESDIQTYTVMTIMEDIGNLQVGFCCAKKRPLIVDELESHAKTGEILAALNGGFIVATAPIDAATGKPSLEDARAYKVEQGEAILFDKGVWHWTPFPQGETATVMVLFKEKTPQEDFISFKLEENLELTE